MAFDREKTFEALRAVAYLAMGVFFCLNEPAAFKDNPGTGFWYATWTFTRYLISAILIFGGGRMLYRIFFVGEEESTKEK